MPSVDTAPGAPLLIRKMSCLSLLVRWGKVEDHSSERPGECGGQGRVCDSFWICLCKVYNFVISRDIPKANSSSELQLHEFAGCFVLGFFKEKEKKVVRSLKAFSAADTSQSNRMGTVGREDSGSSGPMMIILLWIIGGRERVCKEASGIDWSFHWKGRENTFTSSFFSIFFLNFYSFLNVLGTCHVLGQEKDHSQFIIIFPFNEADFFSQYVHFAVHWFGQENLSLLRKILNKAELLAHIQKYSMFLFWVLLETLH